MDLLYTFRVIVNVTTTLENMMELILLGTILVAAMATVDISESTDADDTSPADLLDQGKKPYGVRG